MWFFLFISSALNVCYVWPLHLSLPIQPFPFQLLPAPVPASPARPLSTLTPFFSGMHGWILFELSSLVIIRSVVAFSGVCRALSRGSVTRSRQGGSLEETMKINSFWVSQFLLVYFICFNYMKCVWSSFSPHHLLQPLILSLWPIFFQESMDESWLNYLAFILIISVLLFSEISLGTVSWQCQQKQMQEEEKMKISTFLGKWFSLFILPALIN